MTSPISLFIGGTQNRQAGFGPLTAIGALPEDLNTLINKMYRVSDIAKKEKQYCIIQHTARYIHYQLIDIDVRPVDAETLGTLNISLFIDRGVQLAGGQSPYTLLKRVHDSFRSRCMTPTADGGYRFTGNDIDPKIFSAIVREFAVEPCTTAYVPMTGSRSAILCIAPDKLEDFFRDTQSPEFNDYKDIEIGSACQELTGAFAHLAGLPIPRPVSSTSDTGPVVGIPLRETGKPAGKAPQPHPNPPFVARPEPQLRKPSTSRNRPEPQPTPARKGWIYIVAGCLIALTGFGIAFGLYHHLLAEKEQENAVLWGKLAYYEKKFNEPAQREAKEKAKQEAEAIEKAKQEAEAIEIARREAIEIARREAEEKAEAKQDKINAAREELVRLINKGTSLTQIRTSPPFLLLKKEKLTGDLYAVEMILDPQSFIKIEGFDPSALKNLESIIRKKKANGFKNWADLVQSYRETRNFIIRYSE